MSKLIFAVSRHLCYWYNHRSGLDREIPGLKRSVFAASMNKLYSVYAIGYLYTLKKNMIQLAEIYCLVINRRIILI